MTWRASYHDYLGTAWWGVDEVDDEGRFIQNIAICGNDEALARRIAKLLELEAIVADLLIACKSVSSVGINDEVLDQLAAAIAKAEGEEPTP